MPMTPAPEQPPQKGVQSSLGNVKAEQTVDGSQIAGEEIDLVTSESETSTSGSDFALSEPEQDDELEPAYALHEDPADAWVQNKKSKVIHIIEGMGHMVTDSVYANGELVQDKATKCGRLTNTNFVVIRSIEDWTSKCRLCLKDRRDPYADLR